MFDEGRADLAQALLLFEKLGDDIALGHIHVRMAAGPATGIDYMGLIDATHDARLAGGAISFASLSDRPGPADPGQLPGQLAIDEVLARENQ